MTGKLKKTLLPNLPYLLFVWLFDKLCQAVRLSPGADASEKLLHIAQGFTEAFASLWLRHETSRPPLAKRIYSAPYGRTDQVVMNMIFVCVSGKYKLIPAAQGLPCQLHADLMGLLRRDLPRLKGLDQATAQVRSLVDGVAAGPGKFDICSFGGAAVGRNKQLPVRFLRVADIVNGRFQR